MKKLILFSVIGTMLLFLPQIDASAKKDGTGKGQKKVEICHFTESGSSFPIAVAEPAVNAHLKHGDHVIAPESCNGIDDDCDGKIDEDAIPEICDDGIDNDCDGKADGEDPDCEASCLDISMTSMDHWSTACLGSAACPDPSVYCETGISCIMNGDQAACATVRSACESVCE